MLSEFLMCNQFSQGFNSARGAWPRELRTHVVATASSSDSVLRVSFAQTSLACVSDRFVQGFGFACGLRSVEKFGFARDRRLNFA